MVFVTGTARADIRSTKPIRKGDKSNTAKAIERFTATNQNLDFALSLHKTFQENAIAACNDHARRALAR